MLPLRKGIQQTVSTISTTLRCDYALNEARARPVRCHCHRFSCHPICPSDFRASYVSDLGTKPVQYSNQLLVIFSIDMSWAMFKTAHIIKIKPSRDQRRGQRKHVKVAWQQKLNARMTNLVRYVCSAAASTTLMLHYLLLSLRFEYTYLVYLAYQGM